MGPTCNQTLNMKTVLALIFLGTASCFPDKLARARQGRTSYLAPSGQEEDTLDTYQALPSENTLDTYQALSSESSVARAEPIAIRSQSFEPEASGAFRYAFEGENELKQKAEGSLRTVGEAEVVVMKGEYSYIGLDGNEWKVEWYADETGFHPSAPFLPKSVEPNHPEVAAAVKAQLEFAASEDAVEVASGSASNRNEAYAAPLPLASYSG